MLGRYSRQGSPVVNLITLFLSSQDSFFFFFLSTSKREISSSLRAIFLRRSGLLRSISQIYSHWWLCSLIQSTPMEFLAEGSSGLSDSLRFLQRLVSMSSSSSYSFSQARSQPFTQIRSGSCLEDGPEDQLMLILRGLGNQSSRLMVSFLEKLKCSSSRLSSVILRLSSSSLVQSSQFQMGSCLLGLIIITFSLPNLRSLQQAGSSLSSITFSAVLWDSLNSWWWLWLGLCGSLLVEPKRLLSEQSSQPLLFLKGVVPCTGGMLRYFLIFLRQKMDFYCFYQLAIAARTDSDFQRSCSWVTFLRMSRERQRLGYCEILLRMLIDRSRFSYCAKALRMVSDFSNLSDLFRPASSTTGTGQISIFNGTHLGNLLGENILPIGFSRDSLPPICSQNYNRATSFCSCSMQRVAFSFLLKGRLKSRQTIGRTAKLSRAMLIPQLFMKERRPMFLQFLQKEAISRKLMITEASAQMTCMYFSLQALLSSSSRSAELLAAFTASRKYTRQAAVPVKAKKKGELTQKVASDMIDTDSSKLSLYLPLPTVKNQSTVKFFRKYLTHLLSSPYCCCQLCAC